ncbi:MAG: UbiA-like polyprenyltransferase, partial [Bacillota bacterium]|nr:UbiA-like polyprenyltransferase [Bacillota bacterium]
MDKLRVFFEMIKIEHTLFALPFAYLGAFLAAEGLPPASKLLWITLAMIGARTAAMSLNRVIDRHIDARNPRTAQRALPAGQLRVKEVYLYTVLSFLLLGYSAYKLNLLALMLMPIAVFFLVLYPYTKRFTWTCHLVLGISLGLAPAGAWIGVNGHWALTPVLLGLGVMSWVAGFDVVYACQDVEFDRKEGLHSIPAIFGVQRGLEISAFLHIVAPLFFIAVGVVMS